MYKPIDYKEELQGKDDYESAGEYEINYKLGKEVGKPS
jgi:hypothetical protein